MRNTLFKKYLEEVVEKTNGIIQQGVEPLAVALALRSVASQCDELSIELEKKEKEQNHDKENESVNG